MSSRCLRSFPVFGGRGTCRFGACRRVSGDFVVGAQLLLPVLLVSLYTSQNRVPGISHLFVPFVGQFDAVVGHHLMDLTILIAFGLRMSNQYDEPWFDHFDAVL